MILRPPRSTPLYSSAASDVYKRQGGGRGQEPGQERIFLGQGVVADDGHFTVARRGHQGDDSAALEEAEDALAGASHQLLDLLLRGRWRRVEHPTLAVTVGGVAAVEKDGVKMWIQPEITVG